MMSVSPTALDVSDPSPQAQPGVLVVDDDSAVRQMLELGLQVQGFRVRLAGSGAEALAIYTAHHQDIDLVLLDVRMPDLDGPATLEALGRINPGVRCLFMSGYTGAYTEADLLQRGARGLLTKPFNLQELGARLRQLLAS
jgi:DNA-binding response OmpR family regulator